MRGKPARGFGFRDDREDLDGFAREVIEHPHFPNPKAILRLTQAAEALDPALAYPGWFVPQVPLKGVPHFGPVVGGQSPEGLGRFRGQDDLVPHSGQNIARFDVWSTDRREIQTARGDMTPQRKRNHREGVLRLSDITTELFFVTLDKSEGSFSPHHELS